MRVVLYCLLMVWVTGYPVAGGETPIPPNELQADLDYLYQSLQAAHVNLYANMEKAEMDREFATRRARLVQSMSAKEARIFFQRFVALGKIAHAKIDLPFESFLLMLKDGGAVFPLDLKVKDGAFYVVANDSGIDAIQAGDQLLAINDVPMATWSRRLGAYESADTKTMLHGFFEFKFPFLMWLEVGEVSSFKVTVANAAKQTKTIEVPARDRAFMRAVQQKRKDGLALDGGRSYRVIGEGIGYLRPGPFFNIESDDVWDTAPFHAFIDKAFTDLSSKSVRALIIDLRDNPGGDNGFSDHMLAWFADKPFRFASGFDIKVSPQTTASNAKRVSPDKPHSISAQYARAFAQRERGEVFAFPIAEAKPRQGVRFTRPVYVLINRHSYSNAVFVAAMVQDYGFGTVIGEETSDLASSYGAMEHFTLPNTEITVGYPKAHIVRPSGDTTIRGVVPDIAIETPLIETNDDVVLGKAVVLVKQQVK